METVFSNRLGKNLDIAVMSEKGAVWYSQKAKQPYSIISITSKKKDYYAELKESEYLVDLLRLQFNDLDADTKYIEAPKKEDFVGLKEFIDNLKSNILIVHCGAGVSRSAGVMAAILEYLEVEDYNIFDEKKFMPNRLVYRLAKEELGIGKNQEYYDEVFGE